MEKKKGYYIVDGEYREIPKDKKEKLLFICNRFFSGVVLWFIPWIMLVLISLIQFKQFGFICYSLTTLFFLESFYLYHILRESKDGQGYFFVFSIILNLIFVCLI